MIGVAPLPSQTGNTVELGANWRVQFADVDGTPLSMISFRYIDFGAISYKEIFQNVKTILATPLFSAALERTLGVDQSIVDRPINEAANVTIAILQALTYWEPRCEIMDIAFEADALNGHLTVLLQLKIRNVIYGTDTPYTKNHAFTATGTPKLPAPSLPPILEPVEGPPGPQGPTGERGSLWFTGEGAPPAPTAMRPIVSGGTPVPGPVGPKGEAGTRSSIWLQGTGDPTSATGVLPYDMYLNTANGDVWQFDGTTSTWRKLGR